MASRRNLSLSTALSMLDIPMPEDDDMSEDVFDVYFSGGSDDETAAQGAGAESYDDADLDSDFDPVPSIPDFQQPTGPASYMTDKTPSDFFKLLVTDEMLDQIVEQANVYAQLELSRAHTPRAVLHSTANLPSM